MRFPFHSTIEPVSGVRRRRGTRAYTIVELFLTLAVLMIVLGMMMNLSNRVRRESADKSTRQMLSQLFIRMDQYRQQYGSLPPITSAITDGARPTEKSLQSTALANNADLVRYLKLGDLLSARQKSDDPLTRSLRRQSNRPPILEDPWGTPILFMPQQHPAIGLAPNNTFFFFSAGPDRQFLTREDNVYSYEEITGVKTVD